MADITLYGYTNPPALKSVWQGQFLSFLGLTAQIQPHYMIGRQVDSVVPTIQTATSKDDRISLTFDWDVNPGSPTLSRITTKDPLLTSTAAVSPTAVDILWTLTVPNLTSFTSKDDRVSMVFDNPVNPNTPALSRINSKDPNPTGTNTVSADAFDVLWTLTIPNLTSATSRDDRVNLVFDNPVNAGTPALSRINTKDPDLTGTNTVSADAFDLLWTLTIPNLTSAVSKDDRISLVFDNPVNPNTPALSRINPIDPLPTGMNTVGADAFDILWTIPIPAITDIYPSPTGLRLVFTSSVNIGTPTIHPGGAGSPTVTGEVQNAAADITIQYTLPASPVLTSVAADLTGLTIAFSATVGAGAPVIVPPPAGAPAISGSNQINPSTVRLPWTLPTGLNLLGATCTLDQVSLNFDQPVAVMLFAQNPLLWSITTGTPGAVIPTINSISFAGDSVLVHTSEVTIGASYTIIAPVGGIFNTISGVVWIGNTANFTGAGDSPQVTSAFPTDATHITLIFNEEVDQGSATDPSHYSIVPALNIVAITKINAITYQLTVNPMTPGQTYSITLTNIIDKAKNPI